jgi:uncharacterized OsmC-like protein
MAADPRRISKIEVYFSWPSSAEYPVETLKKLKNAAKTCPVAQSLSPELEQVFTFSF